ncbi:hypothetical protein HII31_03921 [Pseudocercospora fuligena]|uniref:Uncharacterized protein n=1 Tax=Pseudocercospora fuligena TaxID=685502 RepID=A0A8H6RP79_9PEZI|nr:hypothetical protein HII31_03921 [Pseudocercospora fuligena]
MLIPNEKTVPARHHINIEFGDTQLLDQYPDYTRVVARSRVNTCTPGYALSQAGARRLLYEIGVHEVSGAIDIMYQAICDGVRGRDLMVCLSPQPALFNQHRPARPKSTWSDIGESGDESWNEIPTSGTRVNLQKLTNGQTDYFDPYADEQ